MLATAPAVEITVRSEPRYTRAPLLSTCVPARLDPATAPVVLIAEDHEDSRDALRTLLDALGYRVIVATNGAEAVETARANRPDLILMDMMMPVVDGFQATRTLRGDEAFREVPIIAITAMEGAREAVIAAGCNDLAVKPLDIRVFLERLKVWLAAGGAG
jgi:CheY-like chemotaxis protein